MLTEDTQGQLTRLLEIEWPDWMVALYRAAGNDVGSKSYRETLENLVFQINLKEKAVGHLSQNSLVFATDSLESVIGNQTLPPRNELESQVREDQEHAYRG